jgi:hypothetical protein
MSQRNVSAVLYNALQCTHWLIAVVKSRAYAAVITLAVAISTATLSQHIESNCALIVALSLLCAFGLLLLYNITSQQESPMHQTSATDSVFNHAHIVEPHSAAAAIAAAVPASTEAMPARAIALAPVAVASVATLPVTVARNSSSSSSSSSSSEALPIRCVERSLE